MNEFIAVLVLLIAEELRLGCWYSLSEAGKSNNGGLEAFYVLTSLNFCRCIRSRSCRQTRKKARMNWCNKIVSK